MIYQLTVQTLPDGLETQFTPPATTHVVSGGRCELGITDTVDVEQESLLGVGRQPTGGVCNASVKWLAAQYSTDAVPMTHRGVVPTLKFAAAVSTTNHEVYAEHSTHARPISAAAAVTTDGATRSWSASDSDWLRLTDHILCTPTYCHVVH